MWLEQIEAFDASPSSVTPQSPEKKEMAACTSKRRHKDEKDGFVFLALRGVKKKEGCRTPIKPFWQ